MLLKEKIYTKWKEKWLLDPAYRMTKIFYPEPHSTKAKTLLKLNRTELKTLVEVITGQNNLNYINNKIYGTDLLCRFCEEEEETFDHFINDWPCFYQDRCEILKK